MDDPVVSVLMAVHNNEKHIERAVRSILGQSFAAFEMIVIDDCSQDGSIEIIRRLNDPRIRIERNAANIGLTASLVRGVAMARGEYIARIDADDIAYPDRLRTQMEFLRHRPDHGLVGSWFRFIDESGESIATIRVPVEDADIRPALRIGNQFAHSAVMFHRAGYDKVGGYRKFFRYAQDYDLFLRLCEKYKMHNIPEVLADIQVRLDSVSVRSRAIQDLFATKAKECVISGAELPVDTDAWLRPHLGTPFRRSRTRSASYFKCATELRHIWPCYKKRRRLSVRLWFDSFAANPLAFAWMLARAVLSHAGRAIRSATRPPD